MTKKEFTDACRKIYQGAMTKIPLASKACLQPDKNATTDKRGHKTKAIKFCMWGKSKYGFWNRDFSSYHIVYDPAGDLHQKGLLQVRFMFFLKRKQNRKGFNKVVEQILYRLAGKKKFTFVLNEEIALLYRPYSKIHSGWQKAATKDLAWLINQTFPHFQKIV